jgi:hypothetical protein
MILIMRLQTTILLITNKMLIIIIYFLKNLVNLALITNFLKIRVNLYNFYLSNL